MGDFLHMATSCYPGTKTKAIWKPLLKAPTCIYIYIVFFDMALGKLGFDSQGVRGVSDKSLQKAAHWPIPLCYQLAIQNPTGPSKCRCLYGNICLGQVVFSLIY